MRKILFSAFVISALLITVTTATGAYFSDSVTVSGNTFSTGTWATPTPSAGAGDVVINEVMWMGSKDLGLPANDGPNDQWIELKNVSSHTINLKNLYITYKSDAGNENKLAEITGDYNISTGGLYLISHYTLLNSAIKNSPQLSGTTSVNNFGINKFQIKVYSSSAKTLLIDTAGNGSGQPAQGDAVNFYAMERNSSPGVGSDYTNWYTCTDSSTTATYWKASRVERGTPGGPNV